MKNKRLRRLIKKVNMGKIISRDEWLYLAKNWIRLGRKFLKENIVIFPWEEALTDVHMVYSYKDFDRVSDIVLSYAYKEWTLTKEMYEKYYKHTGLNFHEVFVLYDNAWLRIIDFLIDSSLLSEDQIQRIINNDIYLYFGSVMEKLDILPASCMQKYNERINQNFQHIQSGFPEIETDFERKMVSEIQKCMKPYEGFMDSSKFFY